MVPFCRQDEFVPLPIAVQRALYHVEADGDLASKALGD